MFSSFGSTKTLIGITALGRSHCLLRIRHGVKCELDYSLDYFFTIFWTLFWTIEEAHHYYSERA